MKNNNQKTELISPNIAERMLGNNENNRNVNSNHVLHLAHQMKTGNFRLTGDTIKIAKSGRLLDGQHRLLAVIKAGLPVEFIVVRDLEEDVFKFIDTGKVRTATDVLTIAGVENAAKISSLVRFIISYKLGSLASTGHTGGLTGKRKITNFDVSEFYRKHENALINSLPYGYSKNRDKIVPGTFLSGFYYILKDIDAEQK